MLKGVSKVPRSCLRLSTAFSGSFRLISSQNRNLYSHLNSSSSYYSPTSFNQILEKQKKVLNFTSYRFYSHAPELTKEIIEARIVELLEDYTKIKLPADKSIDLNSSFTKDLGLDSFDIVEILMEIEYEFSIIIPDQDADEIKTVGQAVDYIYQQPDAC